MNAVQILIEDNNEIKEFFSQFEEAGERAYKTKQAIAEKTIEEIKAHSQLEEQIYYPAVLKKSGKEIQELILEGLEEHRVADFLIERIQATQPEDETFDAKYKVLTEYLKHHLKEEEKELFPESKKILGIEELNRLGVQMEALEKQLEG